MLRYARKPSSLVRIAAPLMVSGTAVCCAAGCAVVVGLDRYEINDDARNGSDADGGASTDGADGSLGVDAVGSLLICDGGIEDPGCVPLPAGFQLVAIADVGPPDAGSPPPTCPPGLDVASDLRAAPKPQSDACTCECSVMQPATCTGPLTNSSGTAFLCNLSSDPSLYKNSNYGGCNQDIATSPASFQRFAPPAPSGGICALSGVVTFHPDRVDQGPLSRVCDDTSRCSTGVCDARVYEPWIACVAKAGDVDCPISFSKKKLLGTTTTDAGTTIGTVDCGPCDCTVTRTPCTGAITTFLKQNCVSDEETLPLDGTCKLIGSGNTWRSYQVDAKTTTGCTASAKVADIEISSPRTICCP